LSILLKLIEEFLNSSLTSKPSTQLRLAVLIFSADFMLILFILVTTVNKQHFLQRWNRLSKPKTLMELSLFCC